MADNETFLSEEEFLEGITSSFFHWIWYEFMPILFIILFLIFFAFGLCLNIILLAVSVRNNWHKEPVHAFVIQLCLVDLLACAMIVLPTLIAVKKNASAFPDTRGACHFQHVVFTLCFSLTFLLISMAVMERTIRTVNIQVYVKCFGNGCCVGLLVLTLWIFSLLFSVLSMLGQEVTYDNDLFQCTLRFKENPAVMNILFAVCYIAPSCVVVVCFTTMFYQRGQAVKAACSAVNQKKDQDFIANQKKDQDFIDSLPQSQVVVSKERSTCVFFIDKYKPQGYSNHKPQGNSNHKPQGYSNHKPQGNSRRMKATVSSFYQYKYKYRCKRHPLSVCTSSARVSSFQGYDQVDSVIDVRSDVGQSHRPDVGQSHRPDVGQSHRPDVGQSHRPDVGQSHRPGVGQSQRLKAKRKWRCVVQRVTQRRKIIQIFGDKPDDVNHHQSMTYLLTWAVTSACWLLYVLAQYINIYSDRCGPCLSMGVLLGLCTYSCKPLIYICHNLWYRSLFIQTITRLRGRQHSTTAINPPNAT